MEKDEILKHRKNKFLSIGRNKGFTTQTGLNENLTIVDLSLWAKSHSSIYLESFNIYISTTENDIESFSEIIGGDSSVPSEWTQYNYNLDGYIGDSLRCRLHPLSFVNNDEG